MGVNQNHAFWARNGKLKKSLWIQPYTLELEMHSFVLSFVFTIVLVWWHGSAHATLKLQLGLHQKVWSVELHGISHAICERNEDFCPPRFWDRWRGACSARVSFNLEQIEPSIQAFEIRYVIWMYTSISIRDCPPAIVWNIVTWFSKASKANPKLQNPKSKPYRILSYLGPWWNKALKMYSLEMSLIQNLKV